MGHTFASVERRRAELRERRDELTPKLIALQQADTEQRRQAGLARRDDRRDDEQEFDALVKAGEPALAELRAALGAIGDEDGELAKAAREMPVEARQLLAAMRDKLLPYLALCVVGPPAVEKEIAPMRTRFAEIAESLDH
jgi:hypothetical protein